MSTLSNPISVDVKNIPVGIDYGTYYVVLRAVKNRLPFEGATRRMDMAQIQYKTVAPNGATDTDWEESWVGARRLLKTIKCASESDQRVAIEECRCWQVELSAIKVQARNDDGSLRWKDEAQTVPEMVDGKKWSPVSESFITLRPSAPATTATETTAKSTK